MARTRGAIGLPRGAMRRVFDPFRQNLSDLMRDFVLAADPNFDWRTDGSVYQYTRFEVLRGMLGGPIVDPAANRRIISELWANFHAEYEFRFVYSEAIARPIQPCFRPNPIIPFVKLEMRPPGLLPILGIRLGPAVSTDTNIRSLRLALDKLNLSYIKVSKSDIPYVPR